MRVRDASLRSTRAGPCRWKCRENASRCPICHSEERSDEESKRKFVTRFFASLRMTNEMISACSHADAPCRPPPTFPAAPRLRGPSGARQRARQRKARRENNPRRMGFQSEGRLCKKPFPLACLSSSSFRTSGKKRPPEAVTPSGGRKSRQTENRAGGVVSAYSQAAALPGGRLSGLGERFAGNKNRRRSSGCSACGILTAGEIISRTAFRPCG